MDLVGDDPKMTFYMDQSENSRVHTRLNINYVPANHVTVASNDLQCKGRSFPRDKTDKIALAMTYNAERDIGETDENGDPFSNDLLTQIQLCPWYVEWLQERKYTKRKDVVKVWLGKFLVKVSGTRFLPFTFSQIGKCTNPTRSALLMFRCRCFQPS